MLMKLSVVLEDVVVIHLKVPKLEMVAVPVMVANGGAGSNGAAIRRTNSNIQVDVVSGGQITGSSTATGVA